MPITSIQDCVSQHFPPKRKSTTKKKWISNNAVCCVHNGETVDTRGRGGVIFDADGSVSYSCFNCQFKAAYVAGYPMSYKFRKLLGWMGVEDIEIYRLALEALRERDRQEIMGTIKPHVDRVVPVYHFKPKPLPKGALSFYSHVSFYEMADQHAYPAGLVDSVKYVFDRKIDLKKYDCYWTDDRAQKMDCRVIVPFTWKNEVIGYTARARDNTLLPKYLTQVDSGYVYNIDNQQPDWKFVIVCEGVFCAASIDGVAVMKADITQQQIDIIEELDREIIVVPDQNKTGQRLIDLALANKWSVSFPVWTETCDDINQAVVKYGKLFVLKSIIDGVERNSLKIQILRKKIK